MGFSISYVFGAYLLTKYVTLGSAPDGLTPESGQWVGAWWMGFLVPGVLLALTGIPMILFPTQMPAAKVISLSRKRFLYHVSEPELKRIDPVIN
jgi:hypothetical protein